MNAEEISYVSQGFIDIYKEIGIAVKYTPYDSSATVTTKIGKLQLKHLDDKATTINAVFYTDKNTDPDISNEDGSIHASLKVVIEQLTAAGITPQKRDAVDITSLDGTVNRWIVDGFDQKVELGNIFSRLTIVDEAHAVHHG